MKYEIAELMVEFKPKYDMLEKRANKYGCLTKKDSLFEIIVDEKEIKEKVEKESLLDEERAEYTLVGSKFYRELLNYNGCLLHASAVVVEKEAYLFSADSGTGKSTHTSLWLKYLADKNPYILNDDNPAIRIMDDGIYAYGTPFSGKHDLNVNKKVKLKSICFIEQAKVNSIRKVEPKEAIQLFFEQTIMQLEKEKMLKFLELLDKILKEIPIYKLCCDMSQEAVQLSYHTMKGESTNEN